jgi:lipopolysaccharide export system protein LptA
MLKTFFFFLILFNVFVCAAQNEEVIIKADKVTYSDKDKKSSAEGNATLHYKKKDGDFFLRAHMIVALHYESVQDSKGQDEYKQVDADRDVFFENDKYTLNADHCVFENEIKRITCVGNSLLSDKIKKHTVKGKKIILNIKDEYYQVFGEGLDKAEVTLFPDKKD